jgi:hypothetical protein
MNEELENTWKDVEVAYFTVLSWLSPGSTEESHLI